jgi:hypothetical protein
MSSPRICARYVDDPRRGSKVWDDFLNAEERRAEVGVNYSLKIFFGSLKKAVVPSCCGIVYNDVDFGPVLHGCLDNVLRGTRLSSCYRDSRTMTTIVSYLVAHFFSLRLCFKKVIRTLAPRDANSIAIAFPIPREPPVPIAVLFWRVLNTMLIER